MTRRREALVVSIVGGSIVSVTPSNTSINGIRNSCQFFLFRSYFLKSRVER